MAEESEPTEAEYAELIRLQDIATERAFSPTTEPFSVEPFCAQVAWRGKECPMYHFTAVKPKDVCQFLTRPGLEGYRCPACVDASVIYAPIFERGTPEQRKALEHLADMSVRYAQNPVDEEDRMQLELTHYQSLGEAIHIYERLGLKEKAAEAEKVWRLVTTTSTKPTSS